MTTNIDSPATAKTPKNSAQLFKNVKWWPFLAPSIDIYCETFKAQLKLHVSFLCNCMQGSLFSLWFVLPLKRLTNTFNLQEPRRHRGESLGGRWAGATPSGHSFYIKWKRFDRNHLLWCSFLPVEVDLVTLPLESYGLLVHCICCMFMWKILMLWRNVNSIYWNNCIC